MVQFSVDRFNCNQQFTWNWSQSMLSRQFVFFKIHIIH
jgi:hypothetical protein